MPSTATAKVFYDDNTNLVTVPDVTNDETGAYINDATVTITLYTAAGVAINASPITLSYVSGSNGKYQGVAANTLAYPAGMKGTAIITITGDSYTAEIELEVEFERRKG